MSLTQQFLTDIKNFMQEFEMSRTVLGVKALNDHHAIIDWISGKRKPLIKSVDKVYRFMEKYRKEAK